MKHLITLGVVFTMIASAIIAAPGLMAVSEESSDSYPPNITGKLRTQNQNHQRTFLVGYEYSLKGERSKSTHKEGPKRWQGPGHPCDTGFSKLNHRKLMSALLTLTILARGD